MKTKAFLFLCLFLGIGMTQLSAQSPNGKNGTGSVSYQYFVDWPSTIPIYCDGKQVDEVTSTNFFSKTVDHYFMGIFIWEVAKITNVTYTSTRTGEKFVGHGTQKADGSTLTFYFTANLNGDKGNHYILYMVIDMYGNVIEVSSNCHEKN